MIFMTENITKPDEFPTKVGQISSSEGSAASKTLVYQRLQGFNKNAPGYDREKHLALSSRGGKHRKPACKALRRLLSRKQKQFAMDAKVNYREAMTFYKLLLSFEDYKRFSQGQLFELLVLMKNDVDEELRLGTARNPDGSVQYIAEPVRRYVIEAKLREFELLMKAAKVFFPEARDSFNLNFVRSDVPLDSPLLKLVQPLDAARHSPAAPSSSSAAPEKSEASDASPSGQTAPNDASASSESAAAETERKKQSQVISDVNNDDKSQ